MTGRDRLHPRAQPRHGAGPHIAFIAGERFEQARTPNFIPIPPDLAVAVNSPSDRAGDVAEKVQWWLSHGTQSVWVLDPGSQTLTTHWPDGSAHTFKPGDRVDAKDVLPGFDLDLAVIFED